MDLSASAAAWFLIPLLPLCGHVIWSDLSQLKIRNITVELMALSYVVIGPFVLPWDMYLWNFSHLLVALGVGMVLNMVGAMGGGDAKFIAAAAPFVARSDFASVMYIFCGAMLFAYIVHRVAKVSPLRRMVPHWESWHSGSRFPMGFPLGVTLIAYLALVALGRL